MQPLQRRTKQIILLTVAGFAALSGIVWLIQINRTATVTFEFTPQSASATLDGKKVVASELKLKRGTHILKVTKDGFYNGEQKVVVNDARSQYAGVALQSSSGATNNWYEEHSDDSRLLEKINGKSFKQDSKNSVSTTPLIGVLPYSDPDNNFRIDYGAGGSGTAAQTIYVSLRSSNDKTAALKWITDKGYKTKDYTIRDIINPLLGATPYQTTDYLIHDVTFYDNDGTVQQVINIDIFLSGADRADPDTATQQYKEAALKYIRSKGANPNKYVVNYAVN